MEACDIKNRRERSGWQIQRLACCIVGIAVSVEIWNHPMTICSGRAPAGGIARHAMRRIRTPLKSRNSVEEGLMLRLRSDLWAEYQFDADISYWKYMKVLITSNSCITKYISDLNVLELSWNEWISGTKEWGERGEASSSLRFASTWIQNKWHHVASKPSETPFCLSASSLVLKTLPAYQKDEPQTFAHFV